MEEYSLYIGGRDAYKLNKSYLLHTSIAIAENLSNSKNVLLASVNKLEESKNLIASNLDSFFPNLKYECKEVESGWVFKPL